jgi:hypothetical protein
VVIGSLPAKVIYIGSEWKFSANVECMEVYLLTIVYIHDMVLEHGTKRVITVLTKVTC